jgi:hypothetical protein
MVAYAIDCMPLIIEGDQGITCATTQADQRGTDQDIRHACPCLYCATATVRPFAHITRLCTSVRPDAESALKRCHAAANHQAAEAMLQLKQSHSLHAHRAAQKVTLHDGQTCVTQEHCPYLWS